MSDQSNNNTQTPDNESDQENDDRKRGTPSPHQNGEQDSAPSPPSDLKHNTTAPSKLITDLFGAEDDEDSAGPENNEEESHSEKGDLEIDDSEKNEKKEPYDDIAYDDLEEKEKGEPLPMEGEEQRQVVAPGVDIELTAHPLPCIPRAKPIYYVKLPNILSIQPKPFEHDTYDGEDLRDVNEEQDDGTVRLRHKTENVVRWRWGTDENGQRVRDSNTRFVRWSDGTMHLFVGNEVLDVKEQGLSDVHHAFVRQEGFIQHQQQFGKKLLFTPSSLTSKSHLKLREALKNKKTTKRKSKLWATLIDPVKDKEEQEKREEENLKKKKLPIEGESGLETYLEESDDEGNIARIKTRFRSSKQFDDELESSSSRLLAAKRGALPAKRRHADEEDEESDLSYDYKGTDEPAIENKSDSGEERPSKKVKKK